jgi:hypothetical protein
MSTQVSFHFGASHRDWLTLRASTNPFSATGGPLLRLNVPLEARLSDRDIEVDILRFLFDLQLGNTVIGQGEIGPIDYLSTSERYVTAVATCPQEALPYLLNPQPPQGRLTLQLNLGGLLRYRHQFPAGDGRAQGLGEPEVWHSVSIGEKGTHHLDVQVARSDWYEQVVAQLGVGGYLISPLILPYGLPAWKSTLDHLEQAARAITQTDPPAVFGHCRAAVDAMPGAKINIFDAMAEGKKRDAINELTKRVGEYIQSGRHVVPGSGTEQAGEFPVDQRDALFVYNMTKLLIAQIYGLVSTP